MAFKALLIMAYFLVADGSSHPLRLDPPRDSYAFFTGDSFLINCIPDPGIGATRLAWQTPNKKDIVHTRGRVHVEPSARNILGLELVVEDVQYKDQGVFTCSAVVDGREIRIQFTLKVYVSITFWDTPAEQVGNEGTNFMITCYVRADPSPIVSWFFNDSLILDGPRRTIEEDGLFIRNLKISDAGIYICRAVVVTPYRSQIEEKNIAVQVHYKPVWKEGDMNTFYAAVESTGNLTCEATSEPPPIFEWFKGQYVLENSKIYKILNAKYKSTLQVKVRSHSDFGNYLCLVSNTVGEILKDMFLLEGVPPNTPSFTLASEEPGVLRVMIFPSPQDILPLTEYTIQWKQAQNSWKHAREYLTSAGNEFLIQDLDFDTDYAFRVRVRNEIGFSNFTEIFVQRTKDLVVENTVNNTVNDSSSTLNKSQPSRQKIFWRTPYIVIVLAWIFIHPSMIS